VFREWREAGHESGGTRDLAAAITILDRRFGVA
jgi:hypothetical protein